MADISAPAAPSATPATPVENKDVQASAAPSSAAKPASNPGDRAVEEALKGLNPSAPAVEDVEDDGSDLEEDVKKTLTKAEKKAWKLKVGDKDIEITDENEMIKRAQMGYSAEAKWQEAAKMRKQVEGFIGLLQKDPSAALEKLGFNVDEIMEKRIERRIEDMKKTPEQLELEKLRSAHEEMLSTREQERQEAHTRQLEQMQNQYAVQIENDISDALNAPDFGLPKSPYFIKRIADVMIYGLKNKRDITAKQAANIVRDEVKGELQQMYALTPDEAFEQLVGKDRLNKYRRGKIKKPTRQVEQPSPMSDVRSTGTSELNAKAESKEAKKVRSRDFFKNLGSK